MLSHLHLRLTNFSRCNIRHLASPRKERKPSLALSTGHTPCKFSISLELNSSGLKKCTMIQPWVICLILGLVPSIVSLGLVLMGLLTAVQRARCEWSWSRYTSKTAGLPTLGGRHFVGNHLRTFVHAPDNIRIALRAHHELGKTFGWMYNLSPAASTIDLDLIRTIFHDEAEVHVNRLESSVPAAQFGDTTLRARDNKWDAMRKSIAPVIR